MKRIIGTWASEAAMLTAFMAEARAMGFRVVSSPAMRRRSWPQHSGTKPIGYGHIPECLEPGDVIAVEGKLRPSLAVLRQATPPYRRRYADSCKPGPAADFYAVVVPECDSDFRDVADALDVAAWQMHAPIATGEKWYQRPAALGWHLAAHARVVGHPRLDIPDLDVATVPGLPAPRKLTPWKIAAVKLCLLGRTRDLVAADFDTTIVRQRTFVDQGWASLVGRNGRTGVYRLLDRSSRPDLAYPEIVAALEAQGPVVAPVAPVACGPLFVPGAA